MSDHTLDVRSMKLTLPLPPNRANARWHWRTEKKKRHEWYLLATCLHPRSYFPPIPKVVVRATLYLWNRQDPDNLTARLKWPLDWLVERGFIADDSAKVITDLQVSQAIDRKNPRVEIELVSEGLVEESVR